jgi:hypothetical protein
MGKRLTSDWWWSGVLALLTFTIYLLLLPGHFHSVDESAMYVAAHNAWREGNPHTNQMAYSLWAIRPGEAVTMLSPTGDIYTKKSPLMVALMLPFIGLGLRLPAWSTVQTVLLLGPLLTTLTAVWLYWLVRRLEPAAGQRVAVVAALLFALTTMALPYAQTVFSETLASLGLLLAVGALVWGEKRPFSYRYPFLAGVGLSLAIGSNVVYLLLAPIWLVWLLRQTSEWSQWLTAGAVFALPLLLLGGGLLAYNWLRFGAWLETGYHFAPGQEGFTTPLWWGIPGLTLSPARGIAWYAPLTWLGVWGLFYLYRRHSHLAQLILLVIGFHLVVFGAWWEWWGGYAWGPRFLLPLMPLWTLASLPLIARALSMSGVVRWLVALVAAWGLLVQVVGTAVDFNSYEIFLDSHHPAPAGQPLRYHHSPELVWQPRHSPILAHGQMWRSGEWQLPWWATAAHNPPLLSEIPAQIRAAQQSNDVIINLVPELTYELLDRPDLPPVWGLPYRAAASDIQGRQLFEQVKSEADRLWLITWYSPGHPENWYEVELRQAWASVGDSWADGLRLLLLAEPPATITTRPTMLSPTFGPVQLQQYGVTETADTLFVTLTWDTTIALSDNYVSFVHLLDTAGNVVAQQDREPLAGYRPTTTWQINQPVTDRFAFPRHALPAGEWQIVVGWYSWPSLERLPVTVDGQAIPSAQYPLP